MRAAVFGCLMILLLPAALAQQQASAPIYQREQRIERKIDRLSRPVEITPRIDPAQVHRQAQELAQLASSIPAEVDQAQHGILPKELNKKLKRIAKLSKELRSELRL